MRSKFFFLLIYLFYSFAATASETENYFASIRQDPNALYSFLKQMPKGGELHYHLAGGAYPETMLSLASHANFCLDFNSMKMAQFNEQCHGIKSSDVLINPSLYEQAIRAWSMKNFIAGKESGHNHFFASFYKFTPVVANFRPELLAEVMNRAASQNEFYLEIMMLPDNAQSTMFGNQSLSLSDMPKRLQQLLANPAFRKTNALTAKEAARILQQARKNLGCKEQPLQKVCQIKVKFQYYVLREQEPEKVFAQALNGFLAASLSKDIVGVNLVQAEDGLISLRDYQKQMKIFNFLHQAFPQVHIALHAGELSPSDVLPEDLRFHIQEAINTGHAQRIGHGVSIAFEDNAEEVAQQMAKNNIAVEINLISNKKILNVYGKRHPLLYYLKHNIPVVLSTDDEGILRTDLTQQYVEAAYIHGLNYSTLKQISRNALTYSFLAGQSLWANSQRAIPIQICQNLDSSACLHFTRVNEKAFMQRQLEKKFKLFESSYKKALEEKKLNL